MVTPPSLWIPYSGIYWPLSIGGWLSSLLWRLNIPFEWDLGVKMSNKCLKMGDTRKIAILRVNDDQVASGVSCFQTNPSQIKYICFKSNTIVLGRSKTRKSIHGIDYSTIYIYYFYYDGYIMIHPYCDWWINSYFRVVPPFRNSNFQSPSLALWYNSPGRQIVHWMSIHMALAEKSATPNPLVNPHPYWDCHLGTLW